MKSENKSFFILKRLILSYLQSAIFSALVLLAVSAILILLYSFNKGISFITVLSDLISAIKDPASNSFMASITILVCLILYYATQLLFLIVCHLKLRSNLGIGLFKSIKWYALFSLIYFIIYINLKHFSVISLLFDSEYYRSVLDVFINDIKKYGFLFIPLLIPPLLTTISSISKDKGFIAFYNYHISEQNRVESEIRSEQARKEAEKQRIENESKRQAELKLAEQKRAEEEKIANECRQEALEIFNEHKEKFDKLEDPISDTDDTI